MVSRNFQSGDPETLVAFTLDPLATKKKEGSERERRNEREREREKGIRKRK